MDVVALLCITARHVLAGTPAQYHAPAYTFAPQDIQQRCQLWLLAIVWQDTAITPLHDNSTRIAESTCPQKATRQPHEMLTQSCCRGCGSTHHSGTVRSWPLRQTIMWTSMRARWNRGSLNSLPIVVCTSEQASVIIPQPCNEQHDKERSC